MLIFSFIFAVCAHIFIWYAAVQTQCIAIVWFKVSDEWFPNFICVYTIDIFAMLSYSYVYCFVILSDNRQKIYHFSAIFISNKQTNMQKEKREIFFWMLFNSYKVHSNELTKRPRDCIRCVFCVFFLFLSSFFTSWFLCIFFLLSFDVKCIKFK